MRRRCLCNCGPPDPIPGNCICTIETIAVSISGLAKCPDIVNCPNSIAFCPFPTPCSGQETIIWPDPPSGAYILDNCAASCYFMTGLGLPFAAQPDSQCHCVVPWTQISQQPICSQPGVTDYSWLTVQLGGSLTTPMTAAITCRTTNAAGRTCRICASPTCTAACTDYTRGLAVDWIMPSGVSNPSVLGSAFCAGTPFTVRLTAAQVGGLCRACGYNGPGTFGTYPQARTDAVATITRIA